MTEVKDKVIKRLERFINGEGKVVEVHYEAGKYDTAGHAISYTRKVGIWGHATTVFRAEVEVQGKKEVAEQGVKFSFSLPTLDILEAFSLFEEYAEKEMKKIGGEWEAGMREKINKARKEAGRIQVLDSAASAAMQQDIRSNKRFRG